MFRLNFLTACRNIRRNGVYSLLNIAGLAIGLAVGILILLWVRDELSYDGFHKQSANIYKINSHIGSGAAASIWNGSPSPLAVFARQSVPEVDKAVRLLRNNSQHLTSVGSRTFLESSAAYVDPDFFTIFSFPLLEGDPLKPFIDDNSIIITKTLAKKYFGGADPVGKTLVMDQKDNFTVTGVIADFPENSSVSFDMLWPMSRYAHHFRGNGDWKTID